MRVYKFISREWGLKALENSKLKVSIFDELNDPFELLAMGVEDKALRGSLKKWRKNFSKETGLICFSTHWHNPVMWSHYADSHNGMALGFDIPDHLLMQVKYSTRRLSSLPQNSNFKETLWTKYSHWSYESEMRKLIPLASLEKNESGIFLENFEPNLCLREVILGHDYKSCKRNNISSKLGNDGIQITQARLAFKSFL